MQSEAKKNRNPRILTEAGSHASIGEANSQSYFSVSRIMFT